MTGIVTETPRDLGFVLSEANGLLSRESITVAAGAGKVLAGTVLGKVAATGKYFPSPVAQVAGKEGAETAVAILGYEVDATNADVATVAVTNDAEVKNPMLVFDPSVNDATKRAAKLTQLRAVTIKAR
ncbi:head decoration protein [Agrobacterium tumefaciens]|uniref:head decoration protein n=1 Tax=Agrobacterium tumefaciens TaxID=358 RepID=UPI0021CED25B|nr:head decoration protein [Agrobacterium tumefaciens]UXS04464.1 head decoration protein [Agrobacterium tumefaciens]